MSCRHSCNETDCRIINRRCIFLTTDEDRCSKENGAIIKYLKNIGTYETKVKENPLYNSENI